MQSLSLAEFHLLGKRCGLSSPRPEGIVGARGGIRADFIILLIWLYVSSNGRSSGLMLVSETSKIYANQLKNNLNNLPSHFFFLRRKMLWILVSL